MSFQPHTPQSPSQNSPGTSSEAISSVAKAMSSMATTPALPTPAHSVNGISHNDVVMTDDSPQKRKRSIDDTGDRDQKKMYLEDGCKLGIDDLHRDVGPKYLLCQAPHIPSRPNTSTDLFQAYGLTDLAAEVAREKPNGEKNALRKTYKGHIKRLGVAGHFDVQKKSGDFFAMVQVPDHEWGVLQVRGREISEGLSEQTLASLSRAVTMVQGPIPKARWDSSVLGELAPTNGDTSRQTASGKLTTPNTPLATTPAAGRPNMKFPPGQDPTRPKRNIKKRGYGDSSFEGYNETFQDDDGGYDTGEGEGGQKRRKKNPDSTSPYPGAVRQQSYGPGMVGA